MPIGVPPRGAHGECVAAHADLCACVYGQWEPTAHFEALTVSSTSAVVPFAKSATVVDRESLSTSRNPDSLTCTPYHVVVKMVPLPWSSLRRTAQLRKPLTPVINMLSGSTSVWQTLCANCGTSARTQPGINCVVAGSVSCTHAP